MQRLLRLLFPPKAVKDVRRATRAFYRSAPSTNWIDAVRLARTSTLDTEAIIDMVNVKQIPADRVALLMVQMLAMGRLAASPPDDEETAFLALWVRAGRRERELGYITEEQELNNYAAIRRTVFGLD